MLRLFSLAQRHRLTRAAARDITRKCIRRCAECKASVRVRCLGTWAPPAAALCDAGENALHLWLTEAPRFGVGHLYLASGSLSVPE
ncbi:MAG: hypothetical protein AMXMBFR52_15520 [Burkholderiales bacterium]